MQTSYTHRNEHMDDRSVGDLLADLSRQLTTLMRKEIELARLETGQKVAATVMDAIWISIGAALLYAGLLALLATAVIVLSGWTPLWLSTLIVAVLALAVGGAIVMVGKLRLQRREMKPTQTIISFKENKRWIMNRT